jgi:hypothetical protein
MFPALGFSPTVMMIFGFTLHPQPGAYGVCFPSAARLDLMSDLSLAIVLRISISTITA